MVRSDFHDTTLNYLMIYFIHKVIYLLGSSHFLLETECRLLEAISLTVGDLLVCSMVLKYNDLLYLDSAPRS
jgi:hypothetical protein